MCLDGYSSEPGTDFLACAFVRLISEMDADATQALDFTDDDETDDELNTQQRRRPVSAYGLSDL